MYSKVYWISCHPDQSDNLMDHYDSVVTPAIQASEKHIGQQMIKTGVNKWILVSNYVSSNAAHVAEPLVNGLIAPMIEKFGMDIEIIGEGDAARSI